MWCERGLTQQFFQTVEVSKMMVGETGPGLANFIVSTVVEAERLMGVVCEAQGRGRESSVSFQVFSYYLYLLKLS